MARVRVTGTDAINTMSEGGYGGVIRGVGLSPGLCTICRSFDDALRSFSILLCLVSPFSPYCVMRVRVRGLDCLLGGYRPRLHDASRNVS